MNPNYRLLLLILMLWQSFETAFGQSVTLTLPQCQDMALQQYPMTKQRELIAQSSSYSIENISKGIWPQISIAGQATYQSDVTKVPISLPNVSIPTISKDQYKLYGEVIQPLTDIATVQQQKALQEVNAAAQKENLEIELYKLKERINQLYFGVLLTDAQIKQNELLKTDIQTGINKVSAAVNNGTELKSSIDKMKAEMLKAEQREIELKAARKAYLDMLGLFTGKTFNENTQLQTPEAPALTDQINRPELKTLDMREKSFAIQDRLLTIKNMPKFSLFFQAGLGQPSPVNMLSRELSSYYIGGLRLNWSLTGFYTRKNDKQLISLDRKNLAVQRETFLFNTSAILAQQRSEIMKLQQLLKSDNDIISLRNAVKSASSAQLENGVITTNDYLKEVNAEDQARQSKLLHEIQLLMAQYNYQYTTGTN